MKCSALKLLCVKVAEGKKTIQQPGKSSKVTSSKSLKNKYPVSCLYLVLSKIAHFFSPN